MKPNTYRIWTTGVALYYTGSYKEARCKAYIFCVERCVPFSPEQVEVKTKNGWEEVKNEQVKV